MKTRLTHLILHQARTTCLSGCDDYFLPFVNWSSFDGYIIWPFSGKNTNGIRSAVSMAIELETNGISEHSPISLTHIRMSSRNVRMWLRHWHLHCCGCCWSLLVACFERRCRTAVLVEISMQVLSSQSVRSRRDFLGFYFCQTHRRVEMDERKKN